MTVPTYLDDLPHRRARALHAFALGAAPAAWVIGLRIDTDGHLSEVHIPAPDPWSAMRPHLATVSDPAGTQLGVGAETLDTDLAMWFDQDADEPGSGQARNPVASDVTAAFGRVGPVSGPVVFTGTAPAPADCPVGDIADLSVAATILLAGVAPSCDPDSPTIDRAAEFARLDVDIVPAPREAPEHAGNESQVSYDASYDSLAHTVTVDGDLPRCLECDQHTSAGHPEHQPEVLAERDTDQP